jgi:DNA-binding beta-propeller fold protein YncE
MWITRILALAVLAAACTSNTAPESSASTSSLETPARFTLFESGQVRPLALSPSKTRLFAVNTPDGRLEVFDVVGDGLVHRSSIPVGLEPVAVAARSDREVWVVNHVSDSVSVVAIDPSGHGSVTRTLLVGDEPRDIVFGGPHHDRAFITTAHRGQNSPVDSQFFTPGVGRADVWVFDAEHLGASSLGGTPLTIVTLFTDTPRALAVTPDGNTVYAAGLHTGNRTTAIQFPFVSFFGRPAPLTNVEGISVPPSGLIVKFDGSHWRDIAGKVWDAFVRLQLPDTDVFAIDAAANPPVQRPGADGAYAGVGTTLFNMVVNPVNGKVYVTNTDARNEVRFEGEGVHSGGETTRGRLHEARISVLGPGTVQPRHLNKHIDYDTCCAPLPNAENDRSLAQPLGMAVSSDGATLYVAAFGSDKIGVFSTAALESDTFVPSAADHIAVSGGGPSGVVLDEARGRLYVLTRFDNAVSVVDVVARAEIAHHALYNPEPASVVNGRRFLYDARLTSSHGESACASCHVFGDLDALSWELGDPDTNAMPNPGPFATQTDPNPTVHPMKGPMSTQSLRGMANHGPMHWRGDRTGGNDAPSVQPDSGSFDEDAAFKAFNPAFESLLGRDAQLTAAQMQAFTDFTLQITYPPNPVRALDNSLTVEQADGLALFHTISDLGRPAPDGTAHKCAGCHILDRQANAQYGVASPGFFGTDGKIAHEHTLIKVPHLRNLYQKIGFFGSPGLGQHPDPGPVGPQIRGFGFFNDGSVDTIETFLTIGGFGFPAGAEGAIQRRKVASYLLAFDSNMSPIVGQQVTRTTDNAASAQLRIALLIARAEQGECDLIAKGHLGNKELGFLYIGAGQWRWNRVNAQQTTDPLLYPPFGQAGKPLTYTCTPPGAGRRMGIDRDLDGILDGDESPSTSR